MSSQTPKHPARRPVLSPLNVLALGLTFIAICVMAARPPSVSAHGATAMLVPPAITPPPQTPPTYPNARRVPISGVSAVQAATGGSVTQSDITAFVQRHAFPQTNAPDRRQVMSVREETARQVALTLQNVGLPDDTRLWVAQLSGHFVFAGSSQQPDGLTFPYAFEVFLASNGNLVMVGARLQPLSAPPDSTPTPTPAQPTATPAVADTPTPSPTTIVAPTPTPAPQNPPKLSVTPTSTLEYCANNSYPYSITVENAGSGTLNWSTTAPSGITLMPSSGSLSAGASQTITLTGSFISSNHFVVHFTSNGGSASVTIMCQVIG